MRSCASRTIGTAACEIGYGGDELAADRRMPPHQQEFLDRQRCRLAQNRFRQRELADIVQQRTVLNRAQRLVG